MHPALLKFPNPDTHLGVRDHDRAAAIPIQHRAISLVEHVPRVWRVLAQNSPNVGDGNVVIQPAVRVDFCDEGQNGHERTQNVFCAVLMDRAFFNHLSCVVAGQV